MYNVYPYPDSWYSETDWFNHGLSEPIGFRKLDVGHVTTFLGQERESLVLVWRVETWENLKVRGVRSHLVCLYYSVPLQQQSGVQGTQL